MTAMAKQDASRWDQPAQTQVPDIQAPGPPTSQQLSSYSPPPVAIPTAPKAMMYAAFKSAVPTPARTRVMNECKGRDILDPSSTHVSSLIVAPLDQHRVGSQHTQDQLPQFYEEASVDQDTGQQLLHSVELCDNFGCDGYHHHDDCPLERRCWGCRSPNHFWSECPMTCRVCESARHIPKHCSDFIAVDDYGMAYPRRPSSCNAITSQRHEPAEKVFTCDNYGCRDMHSHFDCPLPFICWGCRSTDHFWANCHEHCYKCGAKRHTAEYCHEFELWRDGLSRPKRPPQDVIAYAMKRQREQEIDREQGIEQPSSISSMQQIASSTAKTNSSPTITMSDREDSFPSCQTQDQYDPKQPAMIDPYRVQAREPFGTNHPPEVPRIKRETTTPTPSPDGPHASRRLITDTRFRDREYCTFWLRMGRCNYEHTPLGCKYKHEVPDERTLQAMGIQFVPNWLRGKERPAPKSWVYKAPFPVNTPSQGDQQFLPKQRSECVRPTSGHGSRALPTPSTTASRPPVEPSRMYVRTASLTPASQLDDRRTTSPGVQPFMSETMKAFEEEEYIKQKRHEAVMKRRADEQMLEYEHEMRLAKLRRM